MLQGTYVSGRVSTTVIQLSTNNTTCKCYVRHHALLDNFLKFRSKAKELIGRYKSRFEQMEASLVEKSQYIKLLEINLATLTSRVDAMEDWLCHCGDWEVPQEVPEDDAWSELLYITQEYYTPPVMSMRMIKGPSAIVPIGDLEITRGGFDEEVRDGDMESGSVAEQMAEVVLEESEEESSAGEDIEEFIHPVGGGGPLSLWIGSFTP